METNTEELQLYLSLLFFFYVRQNKGKLKNNIGKEENPEFDIKYVNKASNSIYINDYSHDVSRADWWRRWLYSTNAKDIGMLYIYFAIFSGIFIMPLQNLAIYWKILFSVRQSVGNKKIFKFSLDPQRLHARIIKNT